MALWFNLSRARANSIADQVMAARMASGDAGPNERVALAVALGEDPQAASARVASAEAFRMMGAAHG